MEPRVPVVEVDRRDTHLVGSGAGAVLARASGYWPKGGGDGEAVGWGLAPGRDALCPESGQVNG
jgi:hypothetical protein